MRVRRSLVGRSEVSPLCIYGGWLRVLSAHTTPTLRWSWGVWLSSVFKISQEGFPSLFLPLHPRARLIPSRRASSRIQAPRVPSFLYHTPPHPLPVPKLHLCTLSAIHLFASKAPSFISHAPSSPPLPLIQLWDLGSCCKARLLLSPFMDPPQIDE